MKKILLILLAACIAETISAQPAARRKQQAQQNTSNAQTITTRAQISYPTAAPMDEDVVWRRDIYRIIDLNEDANAGLYYPVEAVGSQMNLFTYLFKLMMRQKINAYEYKLDGNEVFNDASKIKPLAFLDNYHIYYEKKGNGINIDNSDIPSKEVKSYYIKECTYYDQRSATFHTKVIALCPIMSREDDFGDAPQTYPLFWVKYDDIAPYLSKQIIMTSDLNNAATMTLDDYFTKNLYRGKIYKTTNMLGKTLSQYCKTDSAMTKEQKRIEGEITAFEKNIWGDQQLKDSLDSVAKAQLNAKGTKKVRRNRRAGGTSTTSNSSVSKKTRKTSSSASTGGSSSARVSVRRQRH